MEKVKRRARELVELPLEHHEALARINARPIKGVLFTGFGDRKNDAGADHSLGG